MRIISIEWCFMPLSTVISWRQFILFKSFLGFTSSRLGSEVSYPRTLQRKNPEDPVRLEPRTRGLRVKHFTTEPRGTLELFQGKDKTFSLQKAVVSKDVTIMFLNSWIRVQYTCFSLFTKITTLGMWYSKNIVGKCKNAGR